MEKQRTGASPASNNAHVQTVVAEFAKRVEQHQAKVDVLKTLIADLVHQSNTNQADVYNPDALVTSFSKSSSAGQLQCADGHLPSQLGKTLELEREGPRIIDEQDVVSIDMCVEDRKMLDDWKSQYPVVGKVLALMKTEAFDTNSDKFEEKLKISKLPDIEPREFDALIDEAFGDQAALSDIIRSHYIQVLGPILQEAERWNLMDHSIFPRLGMASLKHQYYKAFLEVARAASLSVVTPTSPGMGTIIRKNGDNKIRSISFFGPLLDIERYIDQDLQKSLKANGISISNSPTTRAEVLFFLREICGLDPCVETTLNHVVGGAITDNFCFTLFGIQQRLSSGVCPVIVDGTLTSEMVELLSVSAGYWMSIVRAVGGLTSFIVDKSKSDSDIIMQARGLHEHTNDALARASASNASGCLLFVTGVTTEHANMLASTCRRFHGLALPTILRFVLCVDVVG